MINQEYKERVRLLLRIIPIISAEECFAVHGGTAINLFVQNLPRYSVDIDLTYIPVEPREASLAHIKERLKAIKAKIEAAIPGIAVREVPNKLICTHNGHFVKVEVNDVKRGIIAPPVELPLCDLAQEDFGVFCKARIVPLSQLYGGKITAALDRQHPRDLFDVSLMLDYIKDFDQIKRGFIFCLLGSDRPILESLNPNFNDQRNALTNQFEGMSSTPFTYEQYEATRRRLVEYINHHLTPTDKTFLLGFEDGTPDWDASEYRDFQHYPSIQWKLLNIRKLKGKKSTKARGRHNQDTKLFWILMYDDIVDYDDFSERVGSENDILDLIYDEIWKKTYCPKCKRFNTHSRSKYALKNILCHHCSTQWSALQETIFFKTRIDLVKWCYVIYAISFYPRKVSVKWLMTELKINSYNTVWHMANKVKAVANHSPKDKCIFRELENIFRRHRFI